MTPTDFLSALYAPYEEQAATLRLSVTKKTNRGLEG